MGTADLVSQGSFRFAHTDVITGLAASCAKENIFATCSLDKSSLIWDDRETRPAIGNGCPLNKLSFSLMFDLF